MLTNDLETIELKLFLEALNLRYGYDFEHYARAPLRRIIRRLLVQHGCAHISDLTSRVLHDEAFARAVMSTFTITVTEMFRDPEFYVAVRTRIVPYLKTYPFINVWLAGCATGEEVYSMAILLQEEGLYERATIFATDMNEAALARAREGMYPIRDMRTATLNYQLAGGTGSFSNYYHAKYASAIMAASLKRNITYASHNLVSDGVFSEVHLLLCRNVLIYFDRVLQAHALDLLSDSLINGGYLCLGNKESLRFPAVARRFKVIDEQARIYQKDGERCTS